MSIRLRILLALLLGAPGVLLLLGAPGAPGRGTPAYVVADLGTLPGGADSVASAINDRGQVAGIADAADGHTYAFRTSATGTLADPGADLGTLPGGADSQAISINDRGQVVGQASAAGGALHAFRTSATGTLAAPGADLGILPGGGASMAFAINDCGQVVGDALAADGHDHAFRTSATGTLADPGADLGTLPGYRDGRAVGINDRGQVAGFAEPAYPRPLPALDRARVFRTSATGTLGDPGADLGTLPGYRASKATAINDRGQVVGYALAAHGPLHAFRTSATGTLGDLGTDLGGLPNAPDSWALAINNRGQVVGFAFDSADPDLDHQTAFLYDAAATPPLRDLNTLIPAGSGVALDEAVGINDAGQIAATGTVAGQRHAFRLTPLGLARPAATPTR